MTIMEDSSNNSWKFDQTVAANFAGHARQHIPHYDSVIEKSCTLLRLKLDSAAAICEVGCASGATITKLMSFGFSNITGIDASQHMLDAIDLEIQKRVLLINSTDWPTQLEKFDAIICNWTLHFIKDKINYLENMCGSLSRNGWLILTEKTSLDPDLIVCYHHWKHQQGVSWEDIQKKQSALQTVMHIDSKEWYESHLKRLGFSVRVIDSDWVFTTWACQKI